MVDINNLPQRTPPVDDAGLVELAKRRAEDVEKKRKKFKKIFNLVRLGVLIFLGLFGFWFYIYLKIPRATPIVISENNESTTPINTAPSNKIDPNEWAIYKNDQLRVTVSYLREAIVQMYTTPTPHVEVVYDANTTALDKINDSNLSSGYIFRVTPLNIGIRDIASIADIKRQSYKLKCPESAVFSDIIHTKINDVDAKTFYITNCDADYTISYLARFQMYMEVFQMYKGDYGYRQKYKATTELISSALKFYPEDIGDPIGAFKTYINDSLKFLFLHPNLDENCCNTPAPPFNSINKVIVLGDKATYIDQNNFDGIGVYATSFYAGTYNLDEILASQRKLLIEDFRVVKGSDPITSEREVKVGKFKGVLLHGYTWTGNDLVYSVISTNVGQTIMIFSIKNVSGESFEKTAEAIMGSLETF